MSRLIDLTGQRFTRLVATQRAAGNQNGAALWMCLCDCGKYTIVNSGNLRSGCTNSCGCYKRDKIIEAATSHGEADKAPEYFNWLAMKNRCKNKSHRHWERYGGRGIKVCKRWLNSYQNFIKDMGRRPTQAHSLDRINSNKDYKPSNCRWATPKEQASNRNKRSK